jgi:hypothetical protein
LAREYVHPDGTIDQIDFECRRGYRGCCVASESVWASRFDPALPDWARLISLPAESRQAFQMIRKLAITGTDKDRPTTPATSPPTRTPNITANG